MTRDEKELLFLLEENLKKLLARVEDLERQVKILKKIIKNNLGDGPLTNKKEEGSEKTRATRKKNFF